MALWEKADLLGSPDAPLNLGILYSQGLYPGKPADQVRKHAKAHIPCTLLQKLQIIQWGIICVHQHVAYKFYLKSAERGHLRAAVFLADVWATGIPGYVERRPSDAVSLATSTFFNHTLCTPPLKPSHTIIMNIKSDI